MCAYNYVVFIFPIRCFEIDTSLPFFPQSLHATIALGRPIIVL